MAEKYLNISGLQAFYDEVNNRKVNIANISLESQTTTILAQVKNLATATSSKDYARFYTKSDGGSKNISDRPNTAAAGAGFVCEAICNRFVSTADYRYQLTCWVQADTNPYVAVVSAGTTSITWSRLNTNTDTKVRQLRTTANTAYPVILKWNNTTASGDNTVNFNESFTYNPNTSSLSSINIKSDYISAGLGIHLNHPNDNVKDIKMNGKGISGNDGIDPIETTWVDIINAANSPIKAGVDLKKSGNVISVNTNGTVANSANNDFVIGSSCWVSGYSNFGGGKETKTKGHQNFTFGISSLVYDGSGTMALGQTNSALQENYSLVGGQNSVVETYSGTWSETMNKVTESDKRPSFAFGYGVSAKGGAVVFGNKNFGMGENSAYQGKAYTSKTVVGSSIASIFENNLTAGMNWFSKSPSGGDGGPFVVGSFNWGYNPGTFVAGISSVALPPASFVACKGNIALSYAQSVIGKYNYPEQSLFTIGGGFGDDNRKNVFSITNDGKFYIGRSIFGNNTNSSHWVNDYPEFYVGNTLKLYGSLSAADSLLAYGDISANIGAVYASKIFASDTLTSNYFVTTDGVVSNNLTATNIITSSISSVHSATTSIPLVLSYTSVNADASMSANCAGITASYSNPGGSWNGNASWYNIVNNVNWITNNTSSNSAKSALTSKSALSADSVHWSKGTDDAYRPIGFANADSSASYTAGNAFNNTMVYDNSFNYNPTHKLLQVSNARFYSQNTSGDIVAIIRGKSDFYRNNSVNLNSSIHSCITEIFMCPTGSTTQTATIGISSCLENYYYTVINIHNVNNSYTNATRIEFTGNSNAYTWVRPGGSANVPTNSKATIAIGGQNGGQGLGWATSSKHITIMYCRYGNERFLFTNWL